MLQVTQVHEMFPAISETSIAEDLARTQSVELTVDNILHGRLVQVRVGLRRVLTPLILD